MSCGDVLRDAYPLSWPEINAARDTALRSMRNCFDDLVDEECVERLRYAVERVDARLRATVS